MEHWTHYRDMCNGLPLNPEQGMVRPCPLRATCTRYLEGQKESRIHQHKFMAPPFDFDDETCEQLHEG